MTEKNPEILAQNKKINELNRRVGRLEETMETLRRAIEPDGWISNAFEKMEEHLDEQDKKFDAQNKRFDKLDYNMVELRSSLNHILEHITKLSDLPEE